MVKARININEHANHILNIVKARLGLKNKSQAIRIIVKEYEEKILKTELR